MMNINDNRKYKLVPRESVRVFSWFLRRISR